MPLTPEELKNMEVEYTALTGFYGTVINWRFATATVFLGAVAFILGKETLSQEHYIMLIAFTVGMWIIELRNRSIFRRILERAREIERSWGYPRENHKTYAFFGQMTRRIAREEVIKTNPNLDLPQEGYDPTNLFWFAPTHRLGKYLTHSVGLDILFTSTLLYGLWKSVMLEPAVSGLFVNGANGVSYDVALGLLAGSVIMCFGYRLICFPRILGSTSPTDANTLPSNARTVITIIIGFVMLLVGGAAVVVSAFFPSWFLSH